MPNFVALTSGTGEVHSIPAPTAAATPAGGRVRAGVQIPSPAKMRQCGREWWTASNSVAACAIAAPA